MPQHAEKLQPGASWKPEAQRLLTFEAILELAILAALILFLDWLGLLRLNLPGLIAAGLAYLLVTAFVLSGLRRHAPHSHFGLANAITLCRAAFSVLLLATAIEALTGESRFLDPAYRWALTAGAAIALALDGLDGWVARRAGMSSAFGSRFDMETDALFLLALTALIAVAGVAGPWILTGGFVYYIFRLAAWLWPALAAPLYPSWRRKAVCATQAALLIAALAPPMPAWAALLCCATGLALQLASFGADAAWLIGRAQRD